MHKQHFFLVCVDYKISWVVDDQRMPFFPTLNLLCKISWSMISLWKVHWLSLNIVPVGDCSSLIGARDTVCLCEKMCTLDWLASVWSVSDEICGIYITSCWISHAFSLSPPPPLSLPYMMELFCHYRFPIVIHFIFNCCEIRYVSIKCQRVWYTLWASCGCLGVHGAFAS